MALNFGGGFFGGLGDGISSLFGASGDRKQAGAYMKATKFAERNASLTDVSTGLQLDQAMREITKVIGGQRSDVAGAGLQHSGSAIDLLRASTQEGELTKQLIKTQGLITKTGYEAEAAAYTGQAEAAKAAAKGKTASGIGSLLSAGASLFALSDARCKTDIFLRYRRLDGLGVYGFRYWGDPTFYEGVMAQEVEEVWPDAVHTMPDGIKVVDYAAIGATMRVLQLGA